MYIIIVGAGEIGQQLTEIALANKEDVVVIDKSKEKCDEITRRYDVVAIVADATEKETFEEAGIEKADALVATADDATNLMVVSLAKNMGVPSLVSVVNQKESEPMFQEKNVNIVGNPNILAAEYLYRNVRHPQVTDFMRLGGQAEIFKITLPEESKLVDKTLRELDLPGRVLIIAIERNSDIIIPVEETKLAANDSITVLARKDRIDKAMAQLCAK
jgi:trk system potassium uptake protein TrkA